MSEFTKEQGGVGAYCPFCGDERNLVEIGVPFDDGICHVECARCGAHGPVESAEDRAISAWNLRAGGPAERPALNAKEFSREELETLAGLSAFESNPVVRLAQVAAFALAQMEEKENAEKRMKAWGCPDEDFICLNCGRETPCMTEADLKPGDPGVPCTFDLTYPQMIERMHYHEDQQRQAEAERDRLRAQLDSILANSDSLESGKLADAHAEIKRLREELAGAEEAEAACKELLQVQAERDRLMEERRTLPLDELVYGTRAMHEVVELRVERDRLREELLGAEEAIRLIERITVTYEDARADGDAERVARVGQAFLDHPAVRRARERAGRG